MIDVAFTCSPPNWIRMLPHALMLAATWITVPDDGADDDVAGEDAADAGADTGAEVIAEGEEPAGDATDAEPEDEEAVGAAAAAGLLVLVAEGVAVLAELQALRPSASTAAAATAGKRVDRENITELSKGEPASTRGQASAIYRRRRLLDR